MLLPSSSPKYDDAVADLPRWYQWLLRGRFLLAGVYLFALALLVWAAFFDERFFNIRAERTLRNFSILAVVLFAMQALLLAGAPQLRPSRPTRRRWMYVSLAAGALMGALLTGGLIATLICFTRQEKWLSLFGDSGWLAMGVIVGIPWLVWLGIFGLLWAGEWSGRFRRMYRLLLGGTWVELLVTIPVDVQVRKRTQCYCDEGTFFSMTVGITMAFWTFGPGVLFLFLDIRHRRRFRAGCCTKCGYDLRDLTETRCPECGTAFDSGLSKSESRNPK